MALFTSSNLNTGTVSTVPINWDMNVQEALYAEAVLLSRVLNKSEKVKKGDRVRIHTEAALTAKAVTAATGAFTRDADVPSYITLTVDQWYTVSTEMTDQAEAQSFWDPTNKFTTRAGKAKAVKLDTDLAALHSSIVTNVVGDPDGINAFDINDAASAMLKLDDLNVPATDRSFIIPPVGFYKGILTNVNLAAAYATGLPKSVYSTGFMQPLLGSPMYKSTLMATVAAGGGTVRKGLLLHKDALAIAIQINNEYELARTTPAGTLTSIAVMQFLYGVTVNRENFAVVLNIKSA